MIRVIVAGVTGWVGAPLTEAIKASEDLRLVAAVARASAGEKIGEIAISGTVDEALDTAADVFVDYTSASAVRDHVLSAIRRGLHVVVGSSGLSNEDYEALDREARQADVGVIAVGNFAISAALVQRFAAEAAKHFDSWEIIDTADAAKIDAPSGTARELAWRMSQAASPRLEVRIEDTLGPRESRGADISGSRVHSLRIPGAGIGVEVRFGKTDERLTLAYEGGRGAGPYIDGTLPAIRRASSFRGVVRGLDRLL